MRPIMRGIAAAVLITAAAVAATIFARPGPQSEPAPPTSAAPDAVVAEGERLFNAYCATCHGREAVGTDRGPPLVHPVYEPSHHADEAFMIAALRGSRAHHWTFGDMPPVEGITPQELTPIIAYVRKLQREAGIF